MSQLRSDIKANVDINKIVSIMCYLTIVGWLVSAVLYGKSHCGHARFHLRQSLGLVITAGILTFIPLIGWALNIILFGFWLTAIYKSVIGQQYSIPVLGDLYQEQLDFIG